MAENSWNLSFQVGNLHIKNLQGPLFTSTPRRRFVCVVIVCLLSEIPRTFLLHTVSHAVLPTLHIWWKHLSKRRPPLPSLLSSSPSAWLPSFSRLLLEDREQPAWSGRGEKAPSDEYSSRPSSRGATGASRTQMPPSICQRQDGTNRKLCSAEEGRVMGDRASMSIIVTCRRYNHLLNDLGALKKCPIKQQKPVIIIRRKEKKTWYK